MDIQDLTFDILKQNYCKNTMNIKLLDILDLLLFELNQYNIDIGISLKVFLIELSNILLLNPLEISYFSILFKRLVNYNEDISSEDKLFIIGIISKKKLNVENTLILEHTYKQYTYIVKNLDEFVNLVERNEPSLFDICFLELNSKFNQFNKRAKQINCDTQINYNIVISIITKEFLKDDKRINKNLCKKSK